MLKTYAIPFHHLPFLTTSFQNSPAFTRDNVTYGGYSHGATTVLGTQLWGSRLMHTYTVVNGH